MRLITILLLAAATLPAQTTTRTVRAFGQGSVTIGPDQLKITFGVVTQAATAQDAGSQNASISTTMQTALRKVLGNTGDIATISYNITANYTYPAGRPAQLTGYTATNSVEATSSNTALAGLLIDAATAAGANSIGALRFSLKDNSIQYAQALTAATQQARTHANAIAAGLGAQVGRVITAQEGSVSTPIPLNRLGAVDATAVPTPIDTGTLTVTATVTVDFELN